MSRLAKISILAVVLALGSVAVAMAVWRPWANLEGQLVELDLERPDALVSSAHLSRLPADMLKLPFLREVLSEDFVFYYANTETQKSVEGAVRRIAFEHELTVSDRLVASLLDEPAELALSARPNGKLRYWVMTIRRNALSKTLEGLAKVAPKDSQLQVAGELGANGKKATLYALNLGGGDRTLLFASLDERMVVLSDAAILFGKREAVRPPEPKNEEDANFYAPKPPRIDPPDTLSGLDRDRANKIADLLVGKPADSLFAKRFRIGNELPAGHRVSLAADFLSFGYQGFFPGIEALGFEYTGSEWRSSLLAEGKALSTDFAPLWQALPGQAAACFALPTDWKNVKALAESGMADSKLDFAALAAGLEGPAGVCWYAKSRLATPLFLARFKDEATARKLAPSIAQVFEAAIGAHEYNHEKGKFPVQRTKVQGGVLLKRIVSSPYGNQKPSDDQLGDQLSAPRFFPVTLALSGKVVAFSPDAKLAESAIAVAAKRYPAESDGLKDAAHTLLRVNPARLAQLLQAEAMAALPKDDEPVFNGAAQSLLLPRLAALGRQPGVLAALPAAPASGLQWQTLVWSLEGKK